MVMMMDKQIELLWAIDLANARDAGVKAATDEFHRWSREEGERTEERLKLARNGAGDFTVFELCYAERFRCRCGAGMAYPEGIGSHGAWYCGSILLGQADRSIEHTPAHPFMFYSVRSESQPQAHTTRPAGTHVETVPFLTCMKCCEQWQGERHLASGRNRSVMEKIVCPKCGEKYLHENGSGNSNITSRWHSKAVADDDPDAIKPEVPIIEPATDLAA